MKIEAVDFFYLSMPEVTDDADGSQDALLVRVAAGGHVGWGECEAAPLPSIASLRLPHVAQRLQTGGRLGPRPDARRARRHRRIRPPSPTQPGPAAGAHTLSGIEMAMWDLLGKARGEPV